MWVEPKAMGIPGASPQIPRSFLPKRLACEPNQRTHVSRLTEQVSCLEGFAQLRRFLELGYLLTRVYTCHSYQLHRLDMNSTE